MNHSNRLFFYRWLRHPSRISSVTPSSQHLAKAMLAQLPYNNQPKIVELGAGTGVFTAAMLKSGIPLEDLLVIDIDTEMVSHLRSRFPHIAVEQADARQLPKLVEKQDWLLHKAPEVVISGLGLLTMPSQIRCEILQAAFSTMKPTGRFIQFTYAPFSPVRPSELKRLGLSVKAAGGTWLNFPPARVFVYEKCPVK